MHRAGTWIKRSNIGYRPPSRTEARIHGGSVLFAVPRQAGDVRHVGAGCTQGVCGGVYGGGIRGMYTVFYGVNGQNRPFYSFTHRFFYTSFYTVLVRYTDTAPHVLYPFSRPRRHAGDTELVELKHVKQCGA